MTKPLETLFHPLLNGPILTKTASSVNQWAGRLSANSGDTTLTVSTQVVNSDSLIFATYQTSVASNATQALRVSTISPGNFFSVALNPAPVGTDFTIMWFVQQAS